MLVNFYLVRHGSHDGTHLTEEGRQQVAASAAKHLTAVNFTHCFSSGMPRATETAGIALAAVGQDPLPVFTEEGFGYEFGQKLGAKEAWPLAVHQEHIDARHAIGEPVTAEWAMKDWPPARVMRAGLFFCLRHWAERIGDEEVRIALAGDHDTPPVVNVLVGTHGSAPYAALDPSVITGDLEYGGIIRYTFEFAGNGSPARLVRCDHLEALKVE